MTWGRRCRVCSQAACWDVSNSRRVPLSANAGRVRFLVSTRKPLANSCRCVQGVTSLPTVSWCPRYDQLRVGGQFEWRRTGRSRALTAPATLPWLRQSYAVQRGEGPRASSRNPSSSMEGGVAASTLLSPAGLCVLAVHRSSRLSHLRAASPERTAATEVDASCMGSLPVRGTVRKAKSLASPARGGGGSAARKCQSRATRVPAWARSHATLWLGVRRTVVTTGKSGQKTSRALCQLWRGGRG